MSPITAKRQFRFRPLINFSGALLVFVVVAFIVAPFPYAWIIDAVLIAILFFLYFYVLDKRAINFDCPNCGEHIATNTAWTCGNCSAGNLNGDDFPFINRCQHCGVEPKAYQCHHKNCGELIFLGRDKQQTGFARAFTVAGNDVLTERAKERERQIALADLDEKLAAFELRKERNRRRSPMENVKEKYEQEYGELMAAEEFAAEQRKLIDEKFKDNPELREKANMHLNFFLKRRGTQ
jgi:predicted RNA-binding Zn-ribbon protein involved in translation (DUF1610 family)